MKCMMEGGHGRDHILPLWKQDHMVCGERSGVVWVRKVVNVRIGKGGKKNKVIFKGNSAHCCSVLFTSDKKKVFVLKLHANSV